MRPEIVPFSHEHLDAAGELLAARHRAARTREPELPHRFEDPSEARAALREAWATPHTSAVLALEGGRPAGYLLGSLLLPSPLSARALVMRPRSVFIPYAGHAADGEDRAELYRRMYAAAAPRWLAAGCFTHYVHVPAADPDALAAWFSLGFGQDMIRAWRDTGPVAGAAAPAGLEVHQAGPEDIEVVMRLALGLARHHAESPSFYPYLAETEADQRQFNQQALADPATTYWIAHRDGEAAGMQVFGPPSSPSALITPERCIHLHEGYTESGARGGGVGTALLQHAMAWARESGYERCTVGWVTSNLLAARFWQRSGFRPLGYRLCRPIDERIAWARGTGGAANARE